VSPTIDPQTRSTAVYVQVPNAGGVLKGGTFASGRVVSRVLGGVAAVPLAAVRQSQTINRPFVYRIDGRVIEPVPVQLGVTDERRNVVEILDGVKAGDRVIVGNVGNLGRGMQVTIAGEGNDGGRQGREGAAGGRSGTAPPSP
jgi:multidrug efflux pump subunit AcrA (membrane-fusion protein)